MEATVYFKLASMDYLCYNLKVGKTKQLADKPVPSVGGKGECCPEFDPARWDGKKIQWENKLFVRESVPALFHFPVPFIIKSKISRMMKALERSGMSEDDHKDTLILFSDPTPFRSEIHMSVKVPLEGEKNVKMSGNFISKVFDGSYNSIPKFIKRMREYIRVKFPETSPDFRNQDIFVHYAYCPKCQKKYGHNYLIMFVRIV